jgi:HK97 family phage portal protein
MNPSFTSYDERDANSALRKVAVYAAINLLAGLVASTPIDCFTGTGQNKRQITPPAFFDDPDGSGQGFPDWLYQAMYSDLTRGNLIGRILDTDPLGRPSQVSIFHPDKVSLRELPDGPVWFVSGKEVPAGEVWHRRVFPMPGARMGLSPIGLHALTIGQGLAAAAFGYRWFLDGGHPSAILSNKDQKTIPDTVVKGVKEAFLSAIRGTREPFVMGSGWEYNAIQISPEESQFLDTQKYTSAECARIFGPGVPEILGYETGGTLTYTNTEQRALDLLRFTVDRWYRHFEQILSASMLARPRYVKFNRAALLSTDLLTRYRAHEIALRNKFKTINEVRDTEDAAPVEWGDEPQTGAPAPLQLETQA